MLILILMMLLLRLLVTSCCGVLLEIGRVEWDFFNHLSANYLSWVLIYLIWLLGDELLWLSVYLLNGVRALHYPVNLVHCWAEEFSHFGEVFLALSIVILVLRCQIALMLGLWWVLEIWLLLNRGRLLLLHNRFLLMLISTSVLLLLLHLLLVAVLVIILNRGTFLVDWGESWRVHYSLL